MFWSSGSGLTFDYPLKLIPWYKRPCGGASMWMIDSGVKAEPPTIEQLLRSQILWADVAVCPDILGNAKETIKRTKLWFPEIKKRKPQVKTVVCTQGTDDERRRIMDAFPDADMYGAGLNQDGNKKRFTDEERERIMRWLVPEVHDRGKKVHIFGLGCRLRQLELFCELGVDSFDSSTVVMIAAKGRALDSELHQIRMTDGGTADDKRMLVGLSLRNIELALKRFNDRKAMLF
jgi:queuine/archaeosine tRNA-ribosyltransferase